MFAVKQEIQSSTAFHGVRFALFGFDPPKQDEIRSKLVGGGGVDVGQYGPNCTHVIVDKLVYDDPVCVAARKDGKILVTSLWVRHSSDVGIPVDASPVMYRPVKDLNGILAAKNLVMCLTGYQRQDREDIMAMVSLIGAQFSKPLVANRVTHLICYKFEGEKYELAKRIKKIKLVNHRWLEDCLKAWEVLPEDDYSKSGCELEMEAEAARDSEDETEDINEKQIGERNFTTSPLGLQNRLLGGHGSPILGRKVSYPNQTEDLSTSDPVNTVVIGKEGNRSEHALNATHITEVDLLPSRIEDNEGTRDAKSSGLHALNTTVSSPKKDLLSTCSGSKRSADSNGFKYGSLYYSRKSPKKSGLNLHPVDGGSEYRGKQSGSDLVHVTPSKEHTIMESSVCPKSPLAAASLLVQGSYGLQCYKRKMDAHSDISRGSSKSPKLDSSASKIMGDEDIMTPISASKGTGRSASTRHLSKPVLESAIPKPLLEASTEKACSLKKLQESNGGVSTILTSVTLDGSKSRNQQALSSVGNVGTSRRELIPETSVMSNAEKGTPQNQQRSVNMKSAENNASEIEKLRRLNRELIPETSLMSNAEKGTPQNPQNMIPSAENNVSEVTKSGNSELDLAFAADEPNSRSLKKKSVGQKILGARARLKVGSSSANKKGPICRSGTSSGVDTSVHEDCEIPAGSPKASEANRPERDSVGVGKCHNQPNGDLLQFEINTNDIAKSVDDETEAPADLEMVDNDIGKCREEKPSHLDKTTDEAQGIVDTVANKTSAKSASEEMNEQGGVVSGDDATKKKLNKRKKAVGTKTRKKPNPTVLEVVEPELAVSTEKDVNKRKRAVGTKTRKKPDSTVLEVLEPQLAVSTEKDEGIQSNEGNERVFVSSGNSNGGPLSNNKVNHSLEVEKENQPINGHQNLANSGKGTGKAATKSAKRTTNTGLKKTGNVVQNRNTVEKQPAWFILSGHKLQRKEFQKIIRRLRGRLCRDTHHWSYQATHFIVPDPVRRTEKFFAAAASGSWILKTDYLTASDQAGKLLPEEPYEWHKSGLSEDGAINLEAPRKWRLMRERTGHGAFHGMRIIIYGECIAPPLDTLKRAVKAGDGTILATSPPYTRFLESGVDFAIVSPGMPRVDIWVQEFLKHNIPCVLADYLVEYVCKPGYPLDKHVQYNTHESVAKSFAHLVNLSEEVVVQENEPSTPEEMVRNDDLSCQVCGSADRGDVMMICGNENGSAGCGAGAHIDCCDPPLEEIPEGDWFCPNCAGNGADNSATGIIKKRSSKSRKR